MRDLYREVRQGKDGKDYEVKGITLVGNFTAKVTNDIKEVDTKNGKILVLNSGRSSIACNYYAKSDDGKGYEKKTAFYPFVIWGNAAKAFKEFDKGDGISARGILKEETYSYEKDGKTFTNTKDVITIESFEAVIRTSPFKKNKNNEEEKEDESADTDETMQIDGVDIPF